jgi:hypothetical protein
MTERTQELWFISAGLVAGGLFYAFAPANVVDIIDWLMRRTVKPQARKIVAGLLVSVGAMGLIVSYLATFYP